MSPSQSDLDDARLVPRYSPFLKPLPLPTAQAFDEPTRCLRVNEEWVGYILGALDTLDQADVWQGNEEQVYNARQQVLQIKTALADGDGCEQMPALEIEVVDCQIRYRTNPVDDWTIAPGSLDCGSSGGGTGGCLPVGSVFPSVGDTVPNNCLPLVGGTYLKADYPELFAVMGIGSVWDFDETHFIVPDMRSRAVFGAGLTWNIGNTGGEVNHTLTINEIPGHTHNFSSGTGTGAGAYPARGTSTLAATGHVTASSGSGEAHNNMPPFIALKWYIVATPCPEGTDGVDGASILMDVIDGWIVWRQDTPGSAWINLVPLAELRGLPGADGNDGNNGLQGAPGPVGPTGPVGADGNDGDCLCEGQYEYGTVEKDTEDWDGQACAIASAAAFYMQGQFINSCELIQAGINAAQSIVNIVQQLIGEIPVIGGVVNAAVDYAKDVADKDIADIIAVTNGQDFREQIQCKLYCSFKNSSINQFDQQMFNDALTDLRNWASELLPALPFITFYGQAFALFVDASFTDDNYRHALTGQDERSDNCSILCTDCLPETEWCYEIDFLTADGGFENASGSDYGNWTSGQGWVSETTSGGGQSVWIRRAITPTTVLTHLEIDVTWTNTTGRNIQVNTNNGAIISDVGSPPLSHTYTWDGSESGVNEITLNPSGGAGNVTRTTRLLVRGTGTNPFGADNCA